MAAAAAAGSGAATSLMHAPRPPWRWIAVRGPTRPAAAPEVQRRRRGRGWELYPAAGTRPPRAARAAAILESASRGSEAGSIATAREEGLAEPQALCAPWSDGCGGGSASRPGRAVLSVPLPPAVWPEAGGGNRVRLGSGAFSSARSGDGGGGTAGDGRTRFLRQLMREPVYAGCFGRRGMQGAAVPALVGLPAG